MKHSESNRRSRRGKIADLKGPKITRLLLQMEAAHSQLTVYRSSASVPGQRITVGLTEQEVRVQPTALGGAEYIFLFYWLFRQVMLRF